MQDGDGLFTLLDATALDGFDKVALLVESPALAAEFETLFAGDLGDGTAGSQVALEDSKVRYGTRSVGVLVSGDDPRVNIPNMTSLLDRVVEGSDDLLALPRVASLDHPLVDVFSEGLSGDGQFVTRHQALLDQKGHDGWVEGQMSWDVS